VVDDIAGTVVVVVIVGGAAAEVGEMVEEAISPELVDADTGASGASESRCAPPLSPPHAATMASSATALRRPTRLRAAAV
jgi:hypothetical protein